ncbi:MAG: DsrH/TusB family sulfur metabolism protein [Dehalococcoidia bacterium]|nr:DsrH/TusB family sulfur metabolism protein [Dehalococcoidia bacterium]
MEDRRALETARAHAAEHQVTVVLLQDAVLSPLPWEGEVYACREDLEARGGREGIRGIEYRELVRMIFGHDKVIMW